MNKYEIVGIVGEGAYGIVYKAKNKENGEYGKSSFSFLTYLLQWLSKSSRNQQMRMKS